MEDGALNYDDGILFETTQKRSFPHPHRHNFDRNFGPEQDVRGFPGLGVSDVPPPARGRKHSPRGFADHHYNGIDAGSPSATRNNNNNNANHMGTSPSHAGGVGVGAGPSTTYRSTTSLGLASPTSKYYGGGGGGSGGVTSPHHGGSGLPTYSPMHQQRGGRESAPPGLGHSVSFHPMQH